MSVQDDRVHLCGYGERPEGDLAHGTLHARCAKQNGVIYRGADLPPTQAVYIRCCSQIFTWWDSRQLWWDMMRLQFQDYFVSVRAITVAEARAHGCG